MQTTFYIGQKSKDGYPSKTSMNLYYAEDKTTRPSTIALYVLFAAVVCLALAKVLIYDLSAEVLNAQAQVDKQTAYIDEQMASLKDYGEIKSEYSKYSYSYLTPEELLCDRKEVLEMLETEVFSKVTLRSVMVKDYVVAIEFEGADMAEAAAIQSLLENYKIVESVSLSTASMNSGYSTSMVITLAGGEK